jgi:hypothetical protein
MNCFFRSLLSGMHLTHKSTYVVAQAQRAERKNEQNLEQFHVLVDNSNKASAQLSFLY